MPQGAGNFVKAVDIPADQVLVDRLAVPAVDIPCMAVVVLFVSERCLQDCQLQHS